jgi:hypothetical protein
MSKRTMGIHWPIIKIIKKKKKEQLMEVQKLNAKQTLKKSGNDIWWELAMPILP